jgi:hypothetical protein
MLVTNIMCVLLNKHRKKVIMTDRKSATCIYFSVDISRDEVIGGNVES